MARVYLTSVATSSGCDDATQLEPLRLLREAVARDTLGVHSVVADPGAAELILFVESHQDGALSGPYFDRVRRDPIYRRHRGRCVVISGMDRVVPLVPGLFASIERGWCPAAVARPKPYLVRPNPYLRYEPLGSMTGEGWLASFVGCARDIPVRRRLLQLDDPRILVRDNSEPFIAAVQSGQDERVAALKQEYVITALASRFILCPRGFGSSSIRLFEAMEMGRAPVILADAWVAPDGPDWSSCSLRVPERRVSDLPALLREREGGAAALGAAARREWERYFAPDTLFHWVVEQALRLLTVDPLSRAAGLALARVQLARPVHLRRAIRGAMGRGQGAK